MRVASIYSNIGGWLLGFKAAGYDIVAACEPDPHALAILKHNFHAITIIRDVSAAKSYEIPHCDAVCSSAPVLVGHKQWGDDMGRLCEDIQPRAIALEVAPGFSGPAYALLACLGYRTHRERLLARDFGLPHDRRRMFIVGFRKDLFKYAPPVSFLPFWDEMVPARTLADILEPGCHDEALLVPANRMEALSQRGLQNKEKGFGFRVRILGPNDTCPSLPTRYDKDCHPFLVNDGTGPRRLSVLETKRLMGFRDDFEMPVPRTHAYRLLGQATCPPIARAIAEELGTWLYV